MHDSDIPEPFGIPEPPMTFIEGDEDTDEEVSLLDVFCLLIRIADALGLDADEDVQ